MSSILADSPQTLAVTTVAEMAPIYENETEFIGRPGIDYFWFYPYRIDPDRLFAAVRRVAERFKEFAATLAIDEAGNLWARHAGQPRLRHQDRDETYVGPASSGDLERFLERVRSIPGDPLFAVTLTHLRNGSALCTSVSHMIADGFTNAAFLTHVVAEYRGQAAPAELARPATRPFQRRPDATRALSTAHRIYERDCAAFYNAVLPRARLARLRTDAGISSEVTDGDLLTAFLLQEVAPQMFPDAEQLRARVPVDARRCLAPDQPPSFGDGFLDAVITVPRASLARTCVGELARRIHGEIADFRARIRDHGGRNASAEPLGAQPWFLEHWREIRDSHPFDAATDVVVSHMGRPGVFDFGEGPATERFVAASSPAAFLTRMTEDAVPMTIMSPKPLRLDDFEVL